MWRWICQQHYTTLDQGLTNQNNRKSFLYDWIQKIHSGFVSNSKFTTINCHKCVLWKLISYCKQVTTDIIITNSVPLLLLPYSPIGPMGPMPIGGIMPPMAPILFMPMPGAMPIPCPGPMPGGPPIIGGPPIPPILGPPVGVSSSSESFCDFAPESPETWKYKCYSMVPEGREGVVCINIFSSIYLWLISIAFPKKNFIYKHS